MSVKFVYGAFKAFKVLETFLISQKLGDLYIISFHLQLVMVMIYWEFVVIVIN